MVIGIRVESENIQTGEKKHCNSSYFTMVAKDETGKNVKVPGLIIETEKQVRRFLRALKRAEEKKHRKKAFTYTEKTPGEKLEILTNYNVKLDLKS